jgi:transcriptional regulator with XRE-family HTH domain
MSDLATVPMMTTATHDYDQERKLLLVRFGETVRRVGEDQALSQEELSARCGLHRTAISLIERGLRAPRLSTLVVIAAELNVPTAVLLEGLPVPRTRRGSS